MHPNMTMVKELIESKLTDCTVTVTDLTGTFDHLGLLIVTDDFEGLPLIKQHRLVMDILSDVLKKEVHAVQLKTMTKSAYAQSHS